MDAICEHLELVYRGEIKNLIICVPPGMSKSLLASTIFPSWLWVQDPSLRMIGAAYGQRLSEKHARKHRDLVLSQWHKARWPHVEINAASVRKVSQFETTAKGVRWSTSVGAGITGDHGDYLFFDDLAKAQDAQGKAAVQPEAIRAANRFWFQTMRTRATGPHTRRIGIMQRLHHEDTAGMCIERGYVPLVLPMEFDPERKCVIEIGSHHWEDPRTEPGELLNPARYPREAVDELRRDLGPVRAAAELDQAPTPVGGLVFEGAWYFDPATGREVNRWDPDSLPKKMRKIIVADCTFKTADGTDWVVIQVWGAHSNKYFLLDQRRGRWSVLDTAKQILDLKIAHKTALNAYVEDKANGPAVVQILKQHVTGLREWSPGRSSKIERAQSVAGLVENGDVLYPPGSIAPWFGHFVEEHTRFPFTIHDDTVDAESMALLILHAGRSAALREAYRKIASGQVLL